MTEIRVFREADFRDSTWSGGTTRELAIVPEKAVYADRDFLFRLSTASSDQEESSFTPLPDYDRILMVLEGDVVLAHDARRSARLEPLQQDSFGGEEDTKCFGALTRDYNLIFRKGSRGRMRILQLTEEAVSLGDLPDAEKAGVNETLYTGIFCLDGYVVLNCGGESRMVPEGAQAVIKTAGGEDEELSVMGEGRCILTSVAAPEEEDSGHEPEPDEPEPEKPEPEKTEAGNAADSSGHADGSFAADYKACLRLYFLSNRWSQVMRREGKAGEYRDPELSAALWKLQNRYVTSIVWLIGVLLCFTPVLAGSGPALPVGLAAVFTVLHLLVIAPLIYMKALPRPICDHMKTAEELTESEERYHQQELREDPHMEKMMKRYKSDGENYFADDTSPLRHLIRK